MSDAHPTVQAGDELADLVIEMLYTDGRSQINHRARKRRTDGTRRSSSRTFDEPLELLTVLARSLRVGTPSYVIPNFHQWRMVDHASERWSA